MRFIDLKAQQNRIRAKLDEAINRVLDHGQYIMGPEVRQLEALLAEFVGVRHAIACSSGTDALLLPLLAYRVGVGDAVFTTPFTFFASCEVIALTGATPVFVDVDPDTYNVNPHELRASIEKVAAEGRLNPRGIIPVDLFGHPAAYEAIMEIADQHDLFVLEDGAQAFGATYKGRRAPGLGHIGATSFFPAKPLGCYGDGGAVFTDDDNLAEVVRSLLVHGSGNDKYNNVRIGINARLDTIQAAILIEKLSIFSEEIGLRDQVASRYTEAIDRAGGGLYGIAAPAVSEECSSVWAQYTIVSRQRDELQRRLSGAGVPSMIYYRKPMHLLDAMAYLGHGPGDFPVSEQLSREVVSLPMHPYLTNEDQDLVLKALGV